MACVVEEYKHDNNIGSLVWPVQSPEINIIEPVGIELKERSKIILDKSTPDQLFRCEVF